MKDPLSPLARLAPLLVFVLVLVPFLPGLGNGFVAWDDETYLVQNIAYRGFSAEHLRWMFTDTWHGPYQPLAWLSFAVDHALWGMDPVGYHLSSMVFHAAAAVLLYVAALRLLPAAWPALAERPGGAILGALLAAVLWGVHPLRVESVAWAAERRDVLSAMFLWGSLAVWLRHTGAHGTYGRRWWRSGAYWAALGLFVLSLFSKATAVPWAFVLLVLDVWPLRRGPGVREVAEKALFVAVALPIGAVAWFGQTAAGGVGADAGNTALERLVAAGHSAAFYVGKLAVPIDLRALYGERVDVDPWSGGIVAGAAAALLLTVVLFVTRRRVPAAAAGWTAYLLLLAPVSGFVAVGSQYVADRFAYLASAPLVLLAAGAWTRLRCRPPPAPRIAGGLALVVVAILGGMSWRLTLTWSDTGTLFGRVIAVDPDNLWAAGRLAAHHAREGRLDLAARQLEPAVARDPDHRENVLALADVYAEQERLDDAERLLDRFLGAHPQDAPAWTTFGLVRVRQGQGEVARAAWQRALDFDPDHVTALRNLAEYESRHGTRIATEGLLRRAVALEVGSVDSRVRLAALLESRGLTGEAEALLREAVRLQPGHVGARMRLGGLLDALNEREEAIRHFRWASRALPDEAWVTVRLAQAYDRAGHDAEAAVWARRALEQARASGDVEAQRRAQAVLDR